MAPGAFSGQRYSSDSTGQALQQLAKIGDQDDVSRAVEGDVPLVVKTR